jgi:hypothetical protein
VPSKLEPDAHASDDRLHVKTSPKTRRSKIGPTHSSPAGESGFSRAFVAPLRAGNSAWMQFPDTTSLSRPLAKKKRSVRKGDQGDVGLHCERVAAVSLNRLDGLARTSLVTRVVGHPFTAGKEPSQRDGGCHGSREPAVGLRRCLARRHPPSFGPSRRQESPGWEATPEMRDRSRAVGDS